MLTPVLCEVDAYPHSASYNARPSYGGRSRSLHTNTCPTTQTPFSLLILPSRKLIPFLEVPIPSLPLRSKFLRPCFSRGPDSPIEKPLNVLFSFRRCQSPLEVLTLSQSACTFKELFPSSKVPMTSNSPFYLRGTSRALLRSSRSRDAYSLLDRHTEVMASSSRCPLCP